MNRMWSVLTAPCLVDTVVPSIRGSRSRCTPSRETSPPPLRPSRTQILSISSRNTMPLFSTALIDSCTSCSLSSSLSDSSLTRSSWESATVRRRVLVRPPILPKISPIEIAPICPPGMPGGQMGAISIGDIFGKMGGRTKTRRLTVADSHELLVNEESDKLLDNDQLVQESINAVENNGIVFRDEIDKSCVRDGRRGGDVSREGVQRDLLPLIEGTTVSTKHGAVKTDHILFIASGAFHIAKPSDLLPELQARLPIRV